MADQSSGVLARIGAGITRLRNFCINILFLAILVALSLGLINSCQRTEIPVGAALVINPHGAIVESATLPDPLQALISTAPRVAQVELGVLLEAIHRAADDPDIVMILLDLDELTWAAPAHGQRLGEALKGFRETGKQVVAYGHSFSQAQYHIASFADAIYMHPMGQVVLDGFGGYNLYFSELLEKFDVNVHVYRVGDYKSAVEPLQRNDMSPDARMAAEVLYQSIWQQLLQDLAANRELALPALQRYSDHLGQALKAAGGDMARAALEAYLVDELMTADQVNARLADDVGYQDTHLMEVNGVDYLGYLNARQSQPNHESENKIAVLVAQGTIVNEGRDDEVVTADAMIKLIRQARRDPAIKAVVLRVDSPGGSQLASERIRQELELLQLTGKPLVASFGNRAASGGYWIASNADAIVADPTTITGSIGIFSYLTTFEETLARYGIHADGVVTTPLRGSGMLTGVSDGMAQVLQARVEHGYEQFINLVARGRRMTPDAVEAVAQGRVWSGEMAHELGLVDALGGLPLALQTAADQAGLKTWSELRLRSPVDPRAALLAQLLSPVQMQTDDISNLGHQFAEVVTRLRRFDDPNHTYVLCEPCMQWSGP